MSKPQTAAPIDLNAHRANRAIKNHVAALAAHHADPPEPEPLTEYDQRAIETARRHGYIYPKCPDCLGRHGHWRLCPLPLSPENITADDGLVPLIRHDWNPGEPSVDRVTPEEFAKRYRAASAEIESQAEKAMRAEVAKLDADGHYKARGTYPPSEYQCKNIIRLITAAGYGWRDDEWQAVAALGGCQIAVLIGAAKHDRVNTEMPE